MFPLGPFPTGVRAVPPVTDGNDSFTTFLLHFDSSYSDASSGAIGTTTQGTISIDTTQSKFGGASARFTNAFLYPSSSTPFAFGTNNFTIDFWIRLNSITSNPFIYDGRDSAGAGTAPVIYINTNVFEYFIGGIGTMRQSSTISLATWYHIAVTKSGTVGRLFVNGVQQGATYTDSSNYTGIANRPYIGTHTSGGFAMDGWLEEFRISKGVARWTANFTPPTVAYF